MHVKIEYDPLNGAAVNDGKVDDYWQAVVDGFTIYHNEGIGWVQIPKFATENIFYRARIALVRNEIDHLTFVFRGEEIPVNKIGTIDHWPKGFLDSTETWLAELIDARLGR